MALTKIRVTEKSICVPLYVFRYVFRSGASGLTVSCADSDHKFKHGTSPEQLQKSGQRLKNCLSNLWSERNLD